MRQLLSSDSGFKVKRLEVKLEPVAERLKQHLQAVQDSCCTFGLWLLALTKFLEQCDTRPGGSNERALVWNLMYV